MQIDDPCVLIFQNMYWVIALRRFLSDFTKIGWSGGRAVGRSVGREWRKLKAIAPGTWTGPPHTADQRVAYPPVRGRYGDRHWWNMDMINDI